MINLITPLPFYDSKTEQNQYKENSYGLGMYNNYTDKSAMIPWQISVLNTVTTIDAITLYSAGCIYRLVPASNPAVQIVTDGTNKWIIYTGGQLIFTRASGAIENLSMKSGYWEWQITAGGKTYYSEIFCIPDPLSICYSDWKIKIQAWNISNWNGFYFNNTFKFTMYFDTFISNILAVIADDTVKDGYSRQITSQRVLTPTYVINFDPMPSVLAVALGILTAMKNIIITERNGNQYLVKNIKYTQDNIEGTSLDEVSFQFTVFDNDYISTFCNN